jgi:type IV secretory pathway VirB2 component (pilin)
MIISFLKTIYPPLLAPTYVFAANIIIDPKGPPVQDKAAIAALITRLTQIVTGIAGIVAVAMIVLGGVLYLTSGGSEEQRGKAKKTLTAAIAGLIITICAYAIIYVFANLLGGGIG